MLENMLEEHKGGKRKHLKEYVQNYMFEADTNNDGRISKAEFYKFYKVK